MSKRSIAIISVFVLAIAAVIFQIQTPKILGEATTEIFKGVMIGAEQMKLEKLSPNFRSILIKVRTNQL